MATALASLYTFLPIRNDTAMTGEITLTGMVLSVGGIKEKILAAHRAGIRRVILPAGNEKDLIDVPETVRNEIEFQCVEHVLVALRHVIPQLESRLEHALPAV